MSRIYWLVSFALVAACAPTKESLPDSPQAASSARAVNAGGWAFLEVAQAPADAPIFVSGLAFSPSGKKLSAVVGNERDGSAVVIIDGFEPEIISRSSVLIWGTADDAIWSDESHLAIAGHSDPHNMQSYVLELAVTGSVVEVEWKTPVFVPQAQNQDVSVPGMAVKLERREGKTKVVAATPVHPHVAPGAISSVAPAAEPIIDETGAFQLNGHQILAPAFATDDDMSFARPALRRIGEKFHAAVGRGGFQRAEIAVAWVEIP